MSSEITGAGQQSIKNDINVTVLLPDNQEVETTNGVFDSQEQFCKFLLESKTPMKTTFCTRPSKTWAKDYVTDEFVKAFPLQFPHGIGGFAKEEGLEDFFKNVQQKLSFEERVQHLLQNQESQFHLPQFNLVANGILMRNQVFQQV